MEKSSILKTGIALSLSLLLLSDMPGRTMLGATLPVGTQNIDISTLTPGTYIISLYNGDIKGATKVFVKQ